MHRLIQDISQTRRHWFFLVERILLNQLSLSPSPLLTLSNNNNLLQQEHKTYNCTNLIALNANMLNTKFQRKTVVILSS